MVCELIFLRPRRDFHHFLILLRAQALPLIGGTLTSRHRGPLRRPRLAACSTNALQRDFPFSSGPSHPHCDVIAATGLNSALASEFCRPKLRESSPQLNCLPLYASSSWFLRPDLLASWLQQVQDWSSVERAQCGNRSFIRHSHHLYGRRRCLDCGSAVYREASLA
jgi:hypothetical protein